MGKEELEKAQVAHKEIVETNALADSITAVAKASLSSSPIIDRESTWASGGVAAVSGLAITNMSVMQTTFGNEEVKWLFLTLATSLFFGLVQKVLAVSCSATLKVAETAKNSLNEVIEEFGTHQDQIEDISQAHDLNIAADIDMEKVLQGYIDLYPSWFRRVIAGSAKKGFANRNHAYKGLISRYLGQVASAYIQFFAILVFVVLAAYYV